MQRNQVCSHIIEYLGESQQTKTSSQYLIKIFGGVVHGINVYFVIGMRNSICSEIISNILRLWDTVT